MKKEVMIIIGAILVIVGGFFSYTNYISQDCIQFKKEYESLNNTINSNDQKIREISIPKKNPFVYKEASDIVTMIQNEETFLVYFGFPSCPWCRSILPTLIDVSKDYKVDTIYYVDVKEIRDTIVLDEENHPVTEKEGTSSYYQLLDLLGDILKDYTVKDSDGNPIATGEKRISAPNVVSVVKGKAISMTTGISEKQTNGYMTLTEDMLKDTYQKFETLVKEYIESK